MKIEPKTEQEVQEMGLLPVETYDFEVTDAEEATSKAGNDMTALKLKIQDNSGREFKVLDWLVSTDAMAFKVRHFAETTGLLKEYEAGDLPAHLMIGKTGRAKIGIQPGTGGFRPKNNVLDYVSRSAGPDAPKTAPFEDDDSIPF